MTAPRYDIKELCIIPPPYGGVSVHVQRLVEKMTDDGYLVGAYRSPSNKDPKIVNSGLFDLMEWDSGAPKAKKVWNHILRISRMCRQVGPYKVVHSHSSLEDMFLLWLIRNVCKKKVIVTIHNSMAGEFYQQTDSLNKFFLKRLAKSDVRWIAVSEQAKQETLKLPITFSNEIEVIPAYIPGKLDFSEPLPSALEQYLAGHRKMISFYGHSFMLHNGVDIYGFEAAIGMFEKLLDGGYTDTGLVICIQETDEADKIAKLHAFAKAHNVDDKVYWQEGALNNIQCLWQKTDVYIRPTYTDGDSVAVREILDIGAKVVASDACWRPEGVTTYRYGDLDDMYEKVLDALSAPRGSICQNFQFYDRIKDIYSICLNK